MRSDGMSYQQIGEAVGLTKQGVHKAVKQVSTELTPERVNGKDGKSYPARRTPGIHAGDAEKARDILKDAHELVRTCVARWAISELWKLEDLIERFKRAERDVEPELHTFWTIFHSGYIQAGEEASTVKRHVDKSGVAFATPERWTVLKGGKNLPPERTNGRDGSNPNVLETPCNCSNSG